MLPACCSPRLRWWPLAAALAAACAASAAEPGLLFYASGDKGTTAEVAAEGTAQPTFDFQVTPVADGAKGAALSCGDLQRLAWRAPGNIYAQRGTLSFFWRSRYPVGPTEFPIFRVGYADHSSWDMVWLRIDYNGHGFDAFVTDASLSRTRVSVTLPEFPKPDQWTHLALAWDETRGIRFYVNGKLAAENKTTAVYDAGLDQFGPHSRIISPMNVQSDYNFVRGGDIDEIRIYDRMVNDGAVTALAKGDAPAKLKDRDWASSKDEWLHRYGWDHGMPPFLPAAHTTVRKVEITDTYDLKRWWWKATDGIRETTWPGVYNRSRLPGRHDYFTLPDWDCYSLSGKSITFALPAEPMNQLEISGAAWGKMELLPAGTENETASEAKAEAVLFERPKGQEKTVHVLAKPLTGRKIRFTNVEQEEPIGELSAYNVTAGGEPADAPKIALRLVPGGDLRFGPPAEPSLKALGAFIAGRYLPAERLIAVAQPADAPIPFLDYNTIEKLPIVHVLIPNTWDNREDGLDGIAIDLAQGDMNPEFGNVFAYNIRVKDPLWPLRDMLNFSFSMKSGEKRTLWLDLRDRMLPRGRGLYLTIASSFPGINAASLNGTGLRLVFKPREAARAEHELDRFTQARDSYAMLVEEHPHSDKFALWVRFESDLNDLLRVNPDHVLGRQYAAVALGAPRPEFTQPVPPAGVPLWAFRQVETLRRAQKFVDWWIDHRQIADGEFGGGISDDVDLLNLWPGVALMGAEPDKIRRSLHALLEAAYANGMFTNGLPTIQADELHSYEEGINCLGQNLILDHGSPRQVERAMETARGTAGITGINAAGHRHIRSSYLSGTRLAEEEPWGRAKPYSYLLLQPTLLLVDFNGNPAAKKLLLELADGLLAHRRADEKGVFSLPPSIRFADDREMPATRNYFPWPLFWTAWQWTGDKRYLDPILDGGTSSLMAINANALDTLGIRAEWAPRILGGERGRPAESRVADGRGAPRADPARLAGAGSFGWQLSGDKAVLEKLYARQIQDMAAGEFINTEGSLWSDRVGVPTAELQRARLGGVALTRGALFPGHAVSWSFAAPATADRVALLIPDATPTSFKVIAYNLADEPVRVAMTGGNIAPGLWEIAQGIDTDGDDLADESLTIHTTTFERSRSVGITFAPGRTTVLTCKLITPGTPYWARPDLGIDPEDVVVQDREVRVTVHSLGSVASPATVVALRDRAGRTLTEAMVPALEAPVDLRPRTAVVTLRLPKGAETTGCSVEINPEQRFEEITARNNVVKL